MAKFVITNAWVRINSVDLSNYVKEVTVNLERDDVEITAFGDSGKRRLAGLKDESFELTLLQDFDASKVDATLWPLYNGGSEFLVEVAGAGSAISATNPKYSGSCILTSYPPLDAGVGDAATTKITLPVSGEITRATA